MKKIIKIFLIAITISFIFYLLSFRYRLGLIRYFDPDEFIYLNTAAHVSLGYKPYADFFFLMTPLYLYILAPLYKIFSGLNYIIASRIFSFAVSVLAYLSVGILFWKVKKSCWAFFAPLVFLALPMPSDKLLEIRPDTLSMVFFMGGLIMQISEGKRKTWVLLLSGLFYSLAILTCQKVIVGVVIAGIIFLIKHLHEVKAEKKKNISSFALGLFLPYVIFTVWSITTGNPGWVFYSIGRMAIEVPVQNAKLHPTPALFFFMPNSTYYGSAGFELGFIFNSIVWVLGILACIIGTSVKIIRRKLSYPEALAAGIFITFLINYFFISPLRHPQYLIPASFFVAYYLALIIDHLWKKAEKRKIAMLLFLIFYLGVLAWIRESFLYTHGIKFYWTNSLHLEKINKIWTRVPQNEYLLDLEGRTIDYPYPYYGCCYAFGQFALSMSRPLPDLANALEKTKTKYIYQAEINRIDALAPRDAQYIHDNFQPVTNSQPLGDNELWVRGK